MSSPKLELYFFPQCPFCVMVLDKIHELKISVELRNIRQETVHYEKLIQDTGRSTVPCLYIDDKPMFESSDILEWLHANHDNLAPA